MKASQGYTLMELIIVVMILSITLAIAVPKFKALQADARIRSAANMLAADLKRARSEALVRRTNLNLVQAVVNSTDPWGGGWILMDLALNTTIYQNRSVASPVTIVANPVLASIQFIGISGMVATPASVVTSVSFQICDAKVTGERGMVVQMSSFGRVTVISNPATPVCS